MARKLAVATWHMCTPLPSVPPERSHVMVCPHNRAWQEVTQLVLLSNLVLSRGSDIAMSIDSPGLRTGVDHIRAVTPRPLFIESTNAAAGGLLLDAQARPSPIRHCWRIRAAGRRAIFEYIEGSTAAPFSTQQPQPGRLRTPALSCVVGPTHASVNRGKPRPSGILGRL